ncbi:hypothetical protein C8Q69DRAFT_454819 [Paecilomyces variotii]|uniref:Uncharacterized protein n=1 Tax=Byssochlamys spectabilis TaxID=264951 RepID=A0A443I8L0_BYSSP|nr:hypothetical protein C8Q69DRAFT_454819 [Paecilomyces variotii]RWR00418.1 hypothetical protein C8Q69DRAFT_454819 [Paecilomyces variotii]
MMLIDVGCQVFSAWRLKRELLRRPRLQRETMSYLTGWGHPFEREYEENWDAHNIPSSPELLVNMFNESEYSKRMSDEMAEYRTKIETREASPRRL